MSTNTTMTANTTTTKESNMDISSHPSPRPSRRLSAAALRSAREDMNAKIASFETLAGITGRVRGVLDWADYESDVEFQRARRAARANRLAAAAADNRGGV
jgi:hypothetical protein